MYMYIGDSPLVILIVLSVFLQFRAFHVTSFFSVVFVLIPLPNNLGLGFFCKKVNNSQGHVL